MTRPPEDARSAAVSATGGRSAGNGARPATSRAPGPEVKAAREVSFAALRHPGFRMYFVTTALAMMADNIEHVISYWVIFQVFKSPALGGFAILSHWLPFLFFSVYFGALADRFDTRRVIQASMLLFMAVSLAWGVLFLTQTIELWHAVVLLMVHGLAGVLWIPGSQLLIHHIVGKEHLQSAVRLSATSRFLGLLMGPAVGGGLMLALGPAWGLLANVLIYVPLLVWLFKAPPKPAEDVPSGRAAEAARPAPRLSDGWRDTVAVMRQVSGNRIIVSMIALAGLSSFFIGSAIQPQMPEFAHDLGAEAADVKYSMLLTANAAGAVAGGLILESRGLLQANPRTAIVLAILWCLTIGGFAAADSYVLAIVLMVAAGFLNLTFSSMAQTLVQLESPAPLRGRVIGLYNVANNGLRSFSGVTVGVLGSLIGIHWSLALSAAVLLALCLALLAFAIR